MLPNSLFVAFRNQLLTANSNFLKNLLNGNLLEVNAIKELDSFTNANLAALFSFSLITYNSNFKEHTNFNVKNCVYDLSFLVISMSINEHKKISEVLDSL